MSFALMAALLVLFMVGMPVLMAWITEVIE